MVSLLDLIRQQRDRQTADIAKSSSMQRQQNAESAKKLVNVQVKGFFDALPKPSDLFKFGQQQQKRDNTKRDSKPFKTQVPAKQISQTQRSSIQSFINKKGNIADVFKSFGF